MPHDARRHAAPRIRRVASLAGVLALVGALTSVPGGPGPGGAAAAAPAARMATHASKLANAGPVSLRALARRGTVGRVAAPSIPARLAWQRPGRSGLGNGGGASEPGAGPGRAGDAAASPGAAPGPAGDAAASPGAAPGPGVVGDSAAAPAAAAAAASGPGVVGTAWTGPTDQAIDCGSSRPCLEPPDPWVAVSSTHVVQMVNPVTRITNRTGGGATQVANSAFFNVAAWSTTAFASDPRVLYDPAHDRWVATLFAGTCSGGALFVAVSDTGDPTGTWQRYFKAFNGIWPDFPTLGYSSALVAIGVNEFGVSCGTGGTSIVGAYQGASLHVMDWADLLDGGGTPTISSTSPTPSAFTYVPAAGLTAGSALHAAVALDDGSSKTASLGYLSVSGTLAGGDLLVASPVDLTTLPLAKLQQPPTPVDAGGLIGVQGNALDLRPTDAVWRDGRLAVASTTSCLRGTTYRPCGRIIELATQADLSAPTLRQDLLISPTSGYSDTFTPGVGYSDDGSLWTVFSQSSSARYVSSWARRQLPAAAPGAWSAGSALVAAGRGPYGGIAGAGLNQRWGDYVGVARDPAEPGSVWQANQAADTGGGWMTRVARLGDDVTPPGTGVTRPRIHLRHHGGPDVHPALDHVGHDRSGERGRVGAAPAEHQRGFLDDHRELLGRRRKRHRHGRVWRPLRVPRDGRGQRRERSRLVDGDLVHAGDRLRRLVGGRIPGHLGPHQRRRVPRRRKPLREQRRATGDGHLQRPCGRLGLGGRPDAGQCARLWRRRPAGDLQHVPERHGVSARDQQHDLRRARTAHLPDRGRGQRGPPAGGPGRIHRPSLRRRRAGGTGDPSGPAEPGEVAHQSRALRHPARRERLPMIERWGRGPIQSS